MFYLKIGFRNIMKNYRRSFITMIAVIIGMVSCLLTQGFFNWNTNELRESMIHKGIGHYQIYATGFLKSGNDDPYNYLIQDPAPIIEELQRIPEIELITTRMTFNGIIASGEKSTIVTGEAGIPEKEKQLNAYSSLIAGAKLSSKSPYGLIIGDGVAKKLSAKIGDTLTLIGNMKDGGINAVDLELIGINHSGIADLDNISATISLTAVQNLLNINHDVQKILVLVKDTRDTSKVLPSIKRISRKYGLEYQSWESLADFYHSIKLMYSVVFYIIVFIILIVVTFTISNTVNMNLNDRFREIGTIRALGTRKAQVAWIFISESFLIGLIGGFIGLIISYIFIGFTELIGGLPVIVKGAQQSRIVHVFFHPDLKTIVTCILLFSLVAMLASISPARRGSRLSITEALHWI